jgi:hypothetical protein
VPAPRAEDLGAAVTPNIEEGLRTPKYGMIANRVGVLKEPGHIVGIKRSVLETACPLAAVLIILAMIF